MTLRDWGWRPFFAAQHAENPDTLPARVVAVHRDRIEIAAPDFTTSTQPVGTRGDPESYATVGDWVLYDPVATRAHGPLERLSLMRRRAVGRDTRVQLIAANIDTLFITTSANQDFNIPRLERYLALAHDAGIDPVILLTKTDLADDLDPFIDDLRRLGVLYEIVDARTLDTLDRLKPYLGTGQTLALVGSSGVGKSTLVNTLSGIDKAKTRGIRDDDAKGRHTTTHRAMHQLPLGAWLVDTPGMREIQLADVEDGVEAVFDDLVDLAATCRFSDCKHISEPGCAIKTALADGTIDQERLDRWRKLESEDAHNTKSLVERRASDKSFSKMVKRAISAKTTRKSGD